MPVEHVSAQSGGAVMLSAEKPSLYTDLFNNINPGPLAEGEPRL